MQAAQVSCCYTLRVETPEDNGQKVILAIKACRKLPYGYGFGGRLFEQGGWLCHTAKMYVYHSILNVGGQEGQDAVLLVITVYVQYIDDEFDERSSDLRGSFGDVCDHVESITKENNICWAKHDLDICWTKHDLDQDSGIFDPTAFIRTLEPDLADLTISTMDLWI
jgi:hypothetical protein